mgnify:CR=1 FL=1|jgi:3-hydroxyacyl-[acyl-carrier-protein] dehydratase
MKFVLIDRITKLTPGEEIVGTKSLSLAEEYLADHFPGFPVIPGVLMIEAMTQASAWLIRVTDDFSHSLVTLKEVKNVRYGRFLSPGETMEVTAKIVEHGETETRIKAQGVVDGVTNVKAQLTLTHANLTDQNPVLAKTDQHLIENQRKLLAILCPALLQESSSQ